MDKAHFLFGKKHNVCPACSGVGGMEAEHSDGRLRYCPTLVDNGTGCMKNVHLRQQGRVSSTEPYYGENRRVVFLAALHTAWRMFI